MDKYTSSLENIEKLIVSIDYSSPKNLVEEIMQKKKNEILVKLEVTDMINKAFTTALK